MVDLKFVGVAVLRSHGMLTAFGRGDGHKEATVLCSRNTETKWDLGIRMQNKVNGIIVFVIVISFHLSFISNNFYDFLTVETIFICK